MMFQGTGGQSSSRRGRRPAWGRGPSGAVCPKCWPVAAWGMQTRNPPRVSKDPGLGPPLEADRKAEDGRVLDGPAGWHQTSVDTANPLSSIFPRLL